MPEKYRDNTPKEQPIFKACESLIDSYIADLTGEKQKVGFWTKLAFGINPGASILREHQPNEDPDAIFKMGFDTLIRRIEAASTDTESEKAKYVRALAGKIAL